ncbi:hypothetical protein ACI2L1_36640 [Streptomyces sp. NPDC019531]|uniref:hypothetical protein n=1 Tax=Streptomyces sp. NPDC019531 TaxID=3365062 RepID=UPI00384E091B
MVFSLPGGLPPGRFEQRGPTEIWLCDELPDDGEELWADLLRQAAVTGLHTHLCRPDDAGRPADPAAADAVRLDEVLAADFAEYRRERLPFWSDPGSAEPPDDDIPDDVEPWPHDPGPPFESWPGLAPAGPSAATVLAPRRRRPVRSPICCTPSHSLRPSRSPWSRPAAPPMSRR